MHDSEDNVTQLVLGASLVNYIEINHPSVEVCSLSGARMENVENLLEKTEAQHNADLVKKVVVHLGTNDVTNNKNDVAQVIINYTLGLNTIREKFTKAEVFLTSIPPRYGRSEAVINHNEVSTGVNRYLDRLASTDPMLHYLNTLPLLTYEKTGSPIKKLYDKRDNAGVHLNGDGKQVLKNAFLQALGITEIVLETKRKQQFTPSSEEKTSKCKKECF